MCAPTPRVIFRTNGFVSPLEKPLFTEEVFLELKDTINFVNPMLFNKKKYLSGLALNRYSYEKKYPLMVIKSSKATINF